MPDQQRVDRLLPGAVARSRACRRRSSARAARDSRNAGSVSASYSTTSACASQRAPRRVIRSAAPGPAPTKTTPAQRVPSRLAASSSSLDQQRAAGAVAGRIDDDQRAADAVRRIGLERQRLLRLDDRRGRSRSPPARARRSPRACGCRAGSRCARCAPAPSGCRGAPSTCGRPCAGSVSSQASVAAKRLRRPHACPGVSDPVAARHVELAVEHDAGRLAGLGARRPRCRRTRTSATVARLAAREHLHRVARARRGRARCGPTACAAGGRCLRRRRCRGAHVLHRDAAGRRRVRSCGGRQALEQLQQRRAVVPVGTSSRLAVHVVAAQRRDRHDAGDRRCRPASAKPSSASRTAVEGQRRDRPPRRAC